MDPTGTADARNGARRRGASLGPRAGHIRQRLYEPQGPTSPAGPASPTRAAGLRPRLRSTASSASLPPGSSAALGSSASSTGLPGGGAMHPTLQQVRPSLCC